ncbi:MAG: hypothetical protein E8D47_12935 [Nitrospira sp.]|nr:MAG: hypothetical protein E8D47_12935 [Nitrospira sp.]
MTKIERLARRADLEKAIEKIMAFPMTLEDQILVLSRMMPAVLSGRITPHEARAMIKAIEGNNIR